jgi:hypothetical protein
MKATLGKEERNAALALIVLCLLGIYWIFNKENFITLESWGEYIFAFVYFVGPVLGIIGAIRNIPSAESWQFKLLWYATLITSVAYLVALVYGIYLEMKL